MDLFNLVHESDTVKIGEFSNGTDIALVFENKHGSFSFTMSKKEFGNFIKKLSKIKFDKDKNFKVKKQKKLVKRKLLTNDIRTRFNDLYLSHNINTICHILNIDSITAKKLEDSFWD